VSLSPQVVDLTRTLGEESELWPGTPPLSVESGETIEQDGSFTRRVTLDEHSGTHFDAPSHFATGGWHVSDVPADRLVCPLTVIHFENAATDPDATLSLDDVMRHEDEYGRVAPGAAVFLRTDWNGPSMDGQGRLCFPGFGLDAARFLVEERMVYGLGVDTLGIDPGYAIDFPVHRDVTLPRGVWHVENLVGLGNVPPVGATVVIGVPRIADASGFPVRVLALIPR
jgi:kynurenine formamidase